jgi:hypothetical protein
VVRIQTPSLCDGERELLAANRSGERQQRIGQRRQEQIGVYGLGSAAKTSTGRCGPAVAIGPCRKDSTE